MRWLLIAAVVVGGMGVVFGRQPIDVNIAPLAEVTVNGTLRYGNRDAVAEFAFADVIADGLFDPQYLAELPTANGPASVEYRFPFAVAFSRVFALGIGGQEPVVMRVVDEHGTQADYAWKSVDGAAPSTTIVDVPKTRRLRFTFSGAARVVVNSLDCYVRAPRWLAWTYFAGVQIALPWLIGMSLVLSMLGIGGVFIAVLRRRDEVPADWRALARRFVVGFMPIATLGLHVLRPEVFIAAPTFYSLLAVAPAVIAVRDIVRSAFARRAMALVGIQAFVLLSAVACDSTLVANRRVKPRDHLYGYVVAEHCRIGKLPPLDMMLRPPLISAAIAPLDYLSGRFAYWNYLGMMAALNAATLIFAAAFLERLGDRDAGPAAAWLGLLPILTVLHYCGQRPLTAGLVLFAAALWLRPRGTLSYLGGGAVAALGVLVHPGALFALPPAAAYLVGTLGRRCLRPIVLALFLPIGVYLVWSNVIIPRWYPNERNLLAYYPIMRTLDEPIPSGKTFFRAVADLPADHWRELAMNRVKQLRHYAWADNPWHNEVSEIFRPVSLPSAFGFLAALLVFWPRVWRDRHATVWLLIVGPLALLHLHIGQAFPQFHIVPMPFVAMGLLLACALLPAPRWLCAAVVIEAIARRGEALVLVLLHPLDEYGWFAYRSGAEVGGDQCSGIVLSLIPIGAACLQAWAITWRWDRPA